MRQLLRRAARKYKTTWPLAPRIEPLEPRRLFSAAPFTVGGSPLVHAEDFRLTTFATGLNYPNGMTRLSDGSILVATNKPTDAGGYFGAADGQLVRLYDLNGDGVADGSQVLADNLPRELTDVRLAGNLVLAASPGSVSNGVNPSITILALGSRVYRPLTVLGRLTFTFPTPWMHYIYALETRPTPGSPGSYDIFFNVGSQDDGDTTPTNLTTTLKSSDGRFTGTLRPDSIYKLTITPASRGRIFFSNLTQLAYGLRNAAGIAVRPGTGDLYFEDNGINGGPTGDGDPQLMADELNVIPAGQIGVGPAKDFGFAHDYIHETTGARVGSGAVQPVAAFIPVNGSYSEGPQDIAPSPAAFPPGLDTGMFVGFYGQGNYTGDGTVNTQNPVVFYDIARNRYFDFISNDESALGHPVGLLSTGDSLFVADLSPNNQFAPSNTGVIYQITANPRIFSVSGIAFNDTNGDGIQDNGESPLKYRRIYIDENGDGIFNGNDREVLTDRHGAYSFSLPAGRFTVREDLPPGWAMTTPASFIVKLGSRSGYVSRATRNFGSKPSSAAPMVAPPTIFSNQPIVPHVVRTRRNILADIGVRS